MYEIFQIGNWKFRVMVDKLNLTQAIPVSFTSPIIIQNNVFTSTKNISHYFVLFFFVIFTKKLK